MTFPSNSDTVIGAIFIIQYCYPILAQYSSLLDLFGMNTGQSGMVSDRIPIDDITRLRKPLPQVALLDGIPVVPGIIGSFPGIGGCLLHQTPFVNQRSPSLFQNFLRFIPGAQDYLSDLVKTPIVDLHSLMGKYYWVISTAGVHDRYCPTTEFKNLAKMGNISAFSTMDLFRINGPHGASKVGFGYGVIHNKKVYIYVQEDPCPYQVVITGPKNAKSGQYEYIVITNWAKFPLVAMTRDLAYFNAYYRNELIQLFKNEGYIHEFSELVFSQNLFEDHFGSRHIRRSPGFIMYFRIIGNWMHQVDWINCKPLTPIAFMSNIINRIISGL